MTEKIFTFTAEQVKHIFHAGVRRGEEIQSAYDWGSSVSGGEFDECVNAVHDIVNEGISWRSEEYTEFSTVEKWFGVK